MCNTERMDSQSLLPNQPQPTQTNPVLPQQDLSYLTKRKGFKWVIAIIVVAIFSLGVTYFALKIQMQQNNSNNAVSSSPTSSAVQISPIRAPSRVSDLTTNWKTYTSKDGIFTFQYPQDLYIAELEPSSPKFFSSDISAQNYLNCLINHTGTIDHPCGDGRVFDVSVMSYDKNGYQSLSYVKSKTTDLNIYQFMDYTGREWIIFDSTSIYPIFQSEIQTANQFYRVFLAVYPSELQNYLNKGTLKLESNKKERAFNEEIISTFDFSR